MTPSPPLLLIREHVAFDLEDAPVAEWSATPQAFAGGCFTGSFCVDEAGNAWRITQARLRDEPTRMQQWMAWRRIPVEVTLTSLPAMSASEVANRLINVLRAGNEFCEWLGNRVAPEELERLLADCTTLPEVFQLIRRYVRE